MFLWIFISAEKCGWERTTESEIGKQFPAYNKNKTRS